MFLFFPKRLYDQACLNEYHWEEPVNHKERVVGTEINEVKPIVFFIPLFRDYAL